MRGIRNTQRWTNRQVPKNRKQLRRAAKRIAKRYKRGLENLRNSEAQDGARKTKRNQLAPRFRPIFALKRDIYELACDADRQGSVITMGQLTIERDDEWGIVHRPRQNSAVDWALRLVRNCSFKRPEDAQLAKPEMLFSNTLMSHMSVELNYAFEHQIDPAFVNAFIEELGGFEVISAKLSAGEYDFREADWIDAYQKELRFSHHPKPLFPPLINEEEIESEEKVAAALRERIDDGWPY